MTQLTTQQSKYVAPVLSMPYLIALLLVIGIYASIFTLSLILDDADESQIPLN
jgi:membrane-bound ClpP family serine protease